MRQAFTLIEILISITIFSIIILALYKIVDMSKINIEDFSRIIDNKISNNYKKSVLINDFLESKQISISKLEKNSLLNLVSYNTYHHPLYVNIFYLLHKKNLYRIESFNVISKDNINEIANENLFVDILYRDVESFIVEKGKNKNYLIYIKINTNKEFIVSIPYVLSE